ncbi:MAG TPA: hypothetical protein VFJ16_29365 [Longimicrobium sp.]|nr:hypothetical protein [Longimicrobium sp.]
MTPERPAREPRVRREAPAGRMPPGVKPAVLIFGVAMALEYGALKLLEYTGDGRFLWLGAVVAAATLAVAVLAASRMPRGQRWPFWVAGLACMGAAMTLFAYLCAQALQGL